MTFGLTENQFRGAKIPHPKVCVAAENATACCAVSPPATNIGKNTIPPATGAPPLGSDAAITPKNGVYQASSGFLRPKERRGIMAKIGSKA
eukprot:CAMPEP_0117750590 /NCGR_PEP_ID=MMETSP0947-20121206/10462_1 /TAXON_ID=44440 /ORGANISM="Chattonella subsalsa, Strain CCMP2191" /LENGTH=90 /DNA_ID=CAMNT_0005568793 /DNA_START=1006 /DNA_END=1278 /DNA_ORIENTATION=-